MSMSNAFCTARRPFALEMTTGFAAQRPLGGSGRGGRMGYGMSVAAAAATPAVAEATNSRRDGTVDTRRSSRGGGFVLSAPAGPVNLLRLGGGGTVPTLNPPDRPRRPPRAFPHHAAAP